MTVTESLDVLIDDAVPVNADMTGGTGAGTALEGQNAAFLRAEPVMS
jgi:hypothetical protein